MSLAAHGATPPAADASAPTTSNATRAATALATPDTGAWLDRLERSGQETRDFSAGVTVERIDALSDDREVRRGRVVVDGPPGPSRRIAVLMEEHIDGSGRGSADNRLFLFDQGWLLEFDAPRKRLTRRQLVRDGEAIDPLRVGEGPFPVPLGQPRADVEREFEVSAGTMPDAPIFKRLAERAGDLFTICLVPRSGRPLARDVTRVLVTYEASSLAPLAIEVTADTGDTTRVLLRDAKVNGGLNDMQRALLSPPQFDAATWTVDSRPLPGDAPVAQPATPPPAAEPARPAAEPAPPAKEPVSPPPAKEPVSPPPAPDPGAPPTRDAANPSLPPAAQAAISAEWLTPKERREARIFHGSWTAEDLLDPVARAHAAIIAGDASALPDASLPAPYRAQLSLLRGEPDLALAALTDMPGPEAAWLRARALESLGRMSEAAVAAREGLRDLVDRKARTPAEMTAAAGAIQILLRLTPHDAAAWRAAMDALGAAREQDRLYWPARLAEAAILVEKHNAQEGMAAAKEAAALCPRSAEAALAIGRLALMRFDFDLAESAAATIESAVASVQGLGAPRPGTAPLASLLRAESALIRGDPDSALEALAPLRASCPTHREAIALEASAHALKWDDERMRAMLSLHDSLSPGSGRAHHAVGEQLAMARQYQAAADMLEEAARREPPWSAPRNSLGLLEMQSGRDDRALAALREAARMDPYEKRVAFSLYLMEEMAGWEVLETPHFRVRYRAGIDDVLARDMVESLESVHSEVAGRFGHEPAQRTTIELLPDHQFFGVRITGMPWIHTVAASTGPVIALEPPREGAAGKHLGCFDWLDTVRHEYVHTVTLDRTANRIPHWLTEAAAVDMEHKRRDWQTHELLARALDQDELFDFDEIKWAFVRPKRKTDRALAYAQGHWMVEFMRERHGPDALPRLLLRYERGESESQAMLSVLGMTREQFMQDFLEWARTQVRSWGLAAEPDVAELLPARQDGEGRAPIDAATIASALDAHPEHPDLLEIAARRAVAEADARPGATGRLGDRERDLLQRLAKARPFDPWPRQQLARDALASGDDRAAVPHLEFLDARADSEPSFALELARIARGQRDHSGAAMHAERAVRIDPYDPATRELAASASIEAGDMRAARRHIAALVTLEPANARHRDRLERIEALLQDSGASSTRSIPAGR
jgi:tetratricopeptide (TPR) repeat protein